MTILLSKIKSNKTCLREYGHEHIAKTVEWLNEPLIRKTFGITQKVTIDSHKSWLLSSKHTANLWAIYHDTNYVGNIIISPNQRHRSSYLQIYIGDIQQQSKGVGFDSMKIILKHLFHEKKNHRVWLHCLPDNEKALRLYTKLGFVQEGEERESIWCDGVFLTQLRLSLLKDEWLSE